MRSNNIRRGLLFLLIFFAPFQVGWIFRFLNGVYLFDVPLFFLLFWCALANRNFKFYWALPALGYIIWNLTTGMMAVRYDIVFSEITRFIRGYLAFLCVINSTHSKKDLDTVVVAFFSSFAFQGFLGFLQWRSGYLGLSFLGEDSFYFRAGGLFSHPNVFADFLILFLPVSLRLFAFHKFKKRSYNIVFGILFLFGLAGLLGSYSRGAWLSFVGATIIMLLYSLLKVKYLPRVVGGVAFLVLVGSIFAIHYTPTVISQFEAKNRKGAASVRIPLNKVALSMTKDNAIWGVGNGNYTFHTTRYAHEHVTEEHGYEELLQVVHNTYLLILAETGIVGLWFYGGIFFLIFKYARKVMKNPNPLVSNLGLGIATGYLALFIALTAGPDLRNHQILMVFWILAGLLVVLSRIKPNFQKSQDRFPKRSTIHQVNELADRAANQIKGKRPRVYSQHEVNNKGLERPKDHGSV